MSKLDKTYYGNGYGQYVQIDKNLEEENNKITTKYKPNLPPSKEKDIEKEENQNTTEENPDLECMFEMDDIEEEAQNQPNTSAEQSQAEKYFQGRSNTK